MRIFLSYASDDRELAAEVAESIRARGHEVFFDRTDLPPGDTYEDQIENAIRRSGLMVFLISPDAIADGRFTRTELGFARKKWTTAKNRVLPVMIRSTPITDIPAYLRAVTILEPEGNTPAETASAVNRLARRWTRIIRPGALTVFAVSLFAFVFWYFRPPVASFDVQASAPMAFERGFFGEQDIHNIGFSVDNTGEIAGRIVRVSFEAEPEGALVQVGGGPEIESTAPDLIPPGSSFEGHWLVSASDARIDARWRICAHLEAGAPICTLFESWAPHGEFLYADTFRIPSHLVERASAIAWDEESYLVAATEPDSIVRLNEDGVVLDEATLLGAPQSISVGSLGLFVGMSAPNQIARLNPDNLAVEAKIQLRFPEDLEGTFGDPVSNTPADLAQDAEHLWVITRGGAAANGLGYLNPGLTALRIPPYYDDVNFDLPGMILRSDGAAIWSGDNAVTPASIRRLTTSALEVLSGHEFDIASCASDVLPLAGELLVPDCDGFVHHVSAADGRLELIRRADAILGYSSSADDWSEVLLAKTTDGRFVGAVTVSSRDHTSNQPFSHELFFNTLDWPIGSKLRLAVEDARILDLAVGSTSALIIIESDQSKRQLVAVSLTDD